MRKTKKKKILPEKNENRLAKEIWAILLKNRKGMLYLTIEQIIDSMVRKMIGSGRAGKHFPDGYAEEIKKLIEQWYEWGVLSAEVRGEEYKYKVSEGYDGTGMPVRENPKWLRHPTA